MIQPYKFHGQVSDHLCLASWFGLLTGLLEGLGLVFLPILGLATWNVSKVGVTVEIIWITTLFDLFLFLLLGLASLGFGRFIPQQHSLTITIFCLAFLMWLDFLLLTGRLSLLGCNMLAAGISVAFVRAARQWEGNLVTFCRRSLPYFVILIVLSFGVFLAGKWLTERSSFQNRPVAEVGAPNILVVVMDTVRADHISALGYSRRTSPNIDHLAKTGVLFENGVATSSWTLPSHVSMLTGRFAHEHGVLGEEYDGSFETLGEVLQARGYRTGGFSANGAYFTRARGFQRGFDHFSDFYHSVADSVRRTVLGRRRVFSEVFRWGDQDYVGRKSADLVNRQFLHWLSTTPDRPFFAFLNYFDAHDPYLPPAPFRTKFSKFPSPGGIVNAAVGRNHPNLTAQQIQSETDAYDGSIAYIDSNFGRLLEELTRLGMLQNTVIIITSDHGESFGEHGLTGHRNSLYWHQLHVPIILWGPGRVPSGKRIQHPVSIAALPNTVLDVIGPDNSTLFSARSLRPYWEEPVLPVSSDDATSVMIRMHFEPLRGAPAYYGDIKSLVTHKWHYILNENRPDELYDWTTDPDEKTNLALTVEGRAISRELRARIEEKTRLPGHRTEGRFTWTSRRGSMESRNNPDASGPIRQ